MSFRIRPIHERTFSTHPVQADNQTLDETEIVDDLVFVVDEDTGEIREEKQQVERPVSSTQKENIPELPRKESARVFPLSMKKRTKVSFM